MHTALDIFSSIALIVATAVFGAIFLALAFPRGQNVTMKLLEEKKDRDRASKAGERKSRNVISLIDDSDEEDDLITSGRPSNKGASFPNRSADGSHNRNPSVNRTSVNQPKPVRNRSSMPAAVPAQQTSLNLEGSSANYDEDDLPVIHGCAEAAQFATVGH